MNNYWKVKLIDQEVWNVKVVQRRRTSWLSATPTWMPRCCSERSHQQQNQRKRRISRTSSPLWKIPGIESLSRVEQQRLSSRTLRQTAKLYVELINKSSLSKHSCTFVQLSLKQSHGHWAVQEFVQGTFATTLDCKKELWKSSFRDFGKSPPFCTNTAWLCCRNCFLVALSGKDFGRVWGNG